jgi:hypothetical protein
MMVRAADGGSLEEQQLGKKERRREDMVQGSDSYQSPTCIG